MLSDAMRQAHEADPLDHWKELSGLARSAALFPIPEQPDPEQQARAQAEIAASQREVEDLDG